MATLTLADSIEFEENKTLYHYTSLTTAIEHILPTHSLRLSPLSSVSDPMENNIPIPWFSSFGYSNDCERLTSNIDGNSISKKVKKYYESLRQLCLCRNAKIDFEGQYMGVFEPIDHFGFSKPRMWDQYGDKYKGICIALSRTKLEKQLSAEFDIINVKYHKSDFFRTNLDNSSIDLNQVEKLGEEAYLESKLKSELKKIGEKHNDYRDENECKVIISSENNYEFINISECIQAIFITDKLNYVYESLLKSMANDFNVPLIKLSIDRFGINHKVLES
ncbi:DUF2971 domain-containing protein [Kordia jejudonensis]|uniref:DUF2971 domain-containing protein n=1 Tax=Kordia jejudonensis TaxID=1348245 RepID=UPI00062929D8|nr:DUF2971 domain-containing protein [Kordia jejudonensis]